jgi:hypothetical protein
MPPAPVRRALACRAQISMNSVLYAELICWSNMLIRPSAATPALPRMGREPPELGHAVPAAHQSDSRSCGARTSVFYGQ